MTKVSVIIPTFNRANMLIHAVKSALEQTYNDLEVIVVDDGSTDETEEVVKRIAQDDSRLRYLKHEVNKGMQAARNSGLKVARGQYIAILDSDCEWLAEKVATQVALFEKGSEKLGVVFVSFLSTNSEGKFVTGQIRPIRGEVYADVLARCSPAPTSTLMMKKECFERFGSFDENIICWTEDDMCMIFAKEYEFDYDHRPLVIDRYHTDDRVSTNYARSAKGRYNITEKHRSEILAHCGRKTLGWHYRIAGQLFLEAGDVNSAKDAFMKSYRANPLSLTAFYYALFLLFAPKTLPTAYNIKKQIGYLVRLIIGRLITIRR